MKARKLATVTGLSVKPEDSVRILGAPAVKGAQDPRVIDSCTHKTGR